MLEENEKLLLVDGNSILNRAFYGLTNTNMLSNSEGIYTNGIYGFVNILFKFIDEEKPTHIGIAFDTASPTFRHKQFPAYKANRKGMPPELAMQLPYLRQVLDAMNMFYIEAPGYEADDIIGTMSYKAENSDLDVIIITGDRDALQLTSEKTKVIILTTKAGKPESKSYVPETIMQDYGILPHQFIEIKALMGDSSDNVPGVKGIGEKTAFDLIRNYGTIEAMYENLDKINSTSVKAKLEAGNAIAFIYRMLVTIDRHMDLSIDLSALRRADFNQEKLLELFLKLEFKSFIDRFKLQKNISKVEVTASSTDLRDLEMQSSILNRIKTMCSFAIIPEILSNGRFNDYLISISLSFPDSYYVHIKINSPEDTRYFIAFYREILVNPSIAKIGHDIKNFIFLLKNYGLDFRGLSSDTAIAAYILNPSRNNYDFDNLLNEYLPETSLNNQNKASDLYNLSVKLDELIEKNGQMNLYKNIEIPLITVLADMEFRGFAINKNELILFGEKLEKRLAGIIEAVYMHAGCEFNMNSTKQLASILFEKLKLPPVKKTKTGYSTDAEVLEQLSAKHPIVALILDYRQYAKLKSTYVEGLLKAINPLTGRIHTSFNQTSAVTGRISSTEPNLQNIPVKVESGRELRRVFIAGEDNGKSGKLLLDADYSQIELRVLAHISCDKNMIDAFNSGHDIHIETASKIFNLPEEAVTSEMRQRAKAVNFGIVYGISDFGLAKDLGITRSEGKKYIDEYFEEYPDVKKYMKEIVEEGKKNGYVSTITGRRRYIPELQSSNFTVRSFGERIAMNTPIQGTAADIIKIAMVKIYSELERCQLKSGLILQVHDELIIEVFEDELEEVGQLLRHSMETAILLNVPIKVDINHGKNWYATKG